MKYTISIVLLLFGSLLNGSSKDLDSLLRDAIEANDVNEVTRLLKTEGVDVNAQDQHFEYTVLMIAARKGYDTIVQILLKAGAIIDLQNNNGDTALMLAALYGHNNVVLTLLKNGAQVNLKNNSGKTAFMQAIMVLDKNKMTKNEEVMNTLLQNGALVNIEDDFGFTPLIWAAALDNEKIVNILLKAGAHSNLKNKNDQTALDLAKSDQVKNLLL